MDVGEDISPLTPFSLKLSDSQQGLPLSSELLRTKLLKRVEANSGDDLLGDDDEVGVLATLEFRDSSSFSQSWLEASSNGEELLLLQWNCLVDKVTKEGLYVSFNLPSPTVTTMFYLCRVLKMNFVIRFRALELYDRYLKMFEMQNLEYISTCSDDDLQEFWDRFKKQFLLRMSTCILMASKLHADKQVEALTTTQISKLLKSEGVDYSKKSIALSEMRVLKLLDYKCQWVTPFEIVEQLLCILNLETAALERAHYFSLLLLEYFYLDTEKIHREFSAKKSVKSAGCNDKITVPLQCAAIVSAGLFIVAAETKTGLHKLVAKTASLPEEDVNILAIIILDLLNAD